MAFKSYCYFFELMSFIKKILSLVLIVQPMLLASQNKYPTDYFGSPIDFPISLSALLASYVTDICTQVLISAHKALKVNQ